MFLGTIVISHIPTCVFHASASEWQKCVRGSAWSERAMVGPRGQGVLGHYCDLTHLNVRVSCNFRHKTTMSENGVCF